MCNKPYNSFSTGEFVPGLDGPQAYLAWKQWCMKAFTSDYNHKWFLTDLTQTTCQRSGGPTPYSYQRLKDKAWVKWLNTEISIQRNHTRAGQNYREESLNKNHFPEENDDTGAQGHKCCNGLLCNGELEVALCEWSRFWVGFLQLCHKQTPTGKEHIIRTVAQMNTWGSSWEISSNTSTSGARDVFLIKRHSTHTACVCGKHATQPRHILTDFIKHAVPQQMHSHATTKQVQDENKGLLKCSMQSRDRWTVK